MIEPADSPTPLRTLADLVRNGVVLALMITVGHVVGFSSRNGVVATRT